MMRGCGYLGWRGVGALVAVLAFAGPAGAIDISLPGERKGEIHGFYELRLSFLGDDFPANDVTFSQFRHVLSVETEAQVLPDRIGPLDFVTAFARWVVIYECIYDRACGLAPRASSFGGSSRDLERVPRNIRVTEDQPRFAAGTNFRMRHWPRTLTPQKQELNPNRRFRKLVNEPGVQNYINPVAILPNIEFIPRSLLDRPIDRFGPITSLQGLKTRAGAYNAGLARSYLVSARSSQTPEVAAALDREFRENTLSEGDLGELRELNRRIVATDTSSADRSAALERRNDLLFNEIDGENRAVLDYYGMPQALQGIFQYPDFEGAAERNLLLHRPDPNYFTRLSQLLAPELLTSLWAADQVAQHDLRFYLATLDTPIRPHGYFNTFGRAIDIVDNMALGLASDVRKIDSAGLPPGVPVTDQFRQSVVPLFVGGDGRPNTPDDLPETGLGLAKGLTLAPVPRSQWDSTQGGVALYSQVAYIDGTVDTRPHAGTVDKPYILFGVANRELLRSNGCAVLGGTFADGACSADGEPVVDSRLVELGCSAATQGFASGGLNRQGDCVQLNTSFGSPRGSFPVAQPGIHLDVLPALADPAFRTPGAADEAADLTDFRAMAFSGRTAPARPRNPAGGSLYFPSAGVTKFLRRTHHSVSNLDLAFDEDELKWGHGASEDEHEFREGYLEFEMFDAEVFARVGKLLMVWGKTELFRNQDRINPIDISNDVVTKLEEARIGMWAMDVIYSPEAWMRIGPIEDLRMEIAVIFDRFRGDDLGKCGENSSLVATCLLSFGAFAHGLTGLGLVGVDNPVETASGLAQFEYGIRFEGRLDRFTFAISDFWGWDDAFLIEPVFRYGRRVDPKTGAPVNAFGPLECSIRPGGPNGIAGDEDDEIPSAGNCLLFDDAPAGVAQTVRVGSEIAANHSVNQTLFHTICTLTFDPDLGFCPLDQLNEPFRITGAAELLSGLSGAVVPTELEGVETITWENLPITTPVFVRNLQVSPLLLKQIPGVSSGQRTLPLSTSQGALLGCGPSFVAPCGGNDITRFASSQAYLDVLGLEALGNPVGGIDFQNADASVVLQEFATVKAFQAGAAVGTRNDLSGSSRYEAGITVAGEDAATATHGLDANLLLPLSVEKRAATIRATLEGSGAIEPGASLPASDAWIEPMPWKIDEEAAARGILVFKIADQTRRDRRCDPAGRDLVPDGSGGMVPAFSDGEKVYCRGRNANWTPAAAERAIVLNDPTDPSNLDNEFVIEPPEVLKNDPNALFGESPVLRAWVRRVADVSEQCTPLIQGSPDQRVAGTKFDGGCTILETVSANIERFLVALEVIGHDRHFDPPETVDELLNMVDGDFSNDIAGDPISGPDGIYTKNFRVFADPTGALTSEVDVHAIEFFDPALVIDPDSFADSFDGDGDGLPDGLTSLDLSSLTMREFFRGFNPESACRAEQCYLQVGRVLDVIGRDGSLAGPGSETVQAAALPVATRATLLSFDGETPDRSLRNPKINLLELFHDDRIAFARLWAGEAVVLEDYTLKFERSNLDGGRPTTRTGRVEIELSRSVRSGLNSDRDSDGRPVLELDQDQDGVYDGLDDGSPGPVSDDNILCGTGLRGDLLQSARQHQLISDAEAADLASLFPEGFPERSPVGCSIPNLFFATTGQGLPLRKAGGDGTFGRRDFLWHGGSEVAITWEKRNVLSFGMDFAHDASGTSWGVEVSWVNDASILNSNSPSLNSQTDQYIISVSVDRPTFFNFLNPNRSLFLNLQVFMRYLTDYEGSRSDRDGNFAFVDAPFSGVAVFTFFTGYFQDRLEPRASIVWEPLTGNSIVLWQLGYRWTSSFTSMIRVNHFFGHEVSKQRDFYPFNLYPDSRTREAVLVPSTFGRFQGSVGNRDSLSFDIRYSW